MEVNYSMQLNFLISRSRNKMGDFKKVRVIHSGTFLVMEVENPRTGENQIVYTTNSIDEDKDSYTWEELKPVWW